MIRVTAGGVLSTGVFIPLVLWLHPAPLLGLVMGSAAALIGIIIGAATL